MGLIVSFLEKKHSGKKWFLFIKQLLCRYEAEVNATLISMKNESISENELSTE